MILHGTQQAQVDVPDKEILRALNNIEIPMDTLIGLMFTNFKKRCKVPEDAYIEHNEWKQDVEYHTSHSWYDTEVIRKITTEELAAWNAIVELKTFLP